GALPLRRVQRLEELDRRLEGLGDPRLVQAADLLGAVPLPQVEGRPDARALQGGVAVVLPFAAGEKLRLVTNVPDSCPVRTPRKGSRCVVSSCPPGPRGHRPVVGRESNLCPTTGMRGV